MNVQNSLVHSSTRYNTLMVILVSAPTMLNILKIYYGHNDNYHPKNVRPVTEQFVLKY